MQPWAPSARRAIAWAADAPRPTPIDWPVERDLAIRAHRLLEEHTGREVGSFCYPNGDHDTRVRRLVAEHGYSHALGTRRGYLRRGLSPYELPRIGVGQNHAAEVPLLMWHLAYASR